VLSPANELAYSQQAISKYQPRRPFDFSARANLFELAAHLDESTSNEPLLTQHLIDQFERLIRRDPGRRGLISSEPQFGRLCDGHLKLAAMHLAEQGSSVAIVTGFFIPRADPPAAETDGPLGALMLAKLLEQAGLTTCIITDRHCIHAIQVGAEFVEYAPEQVIECQEPAFEWCQDFVESDVGRELTHLIAIERAGPSHTLESFIAQPRYSDPPHDDFETQVPPDARNRCHNMRGAIIDQHTIELHHLFEIARIARPELRTIGIGDGGNEIGMGTIAWEDIARRLPGESSGRIVCRIATDWTIIAGTSNWGGYALAAGVLSELGRTELLRDWNQTHQLELLNHIVREGPAVDGITALAEATVDALPFATYIQPWESMRRLMALDDRDPS